MAFHSDRVTRHHGVGRIVLTALVLPLLSLGALTLFTLADRLIPEQTPMPAGSLTVHLPLAAHEIPSGDAGPTPEPEPEPAPAESEPTAAPTTDSTVHLQLLDGENTIDLTGGVGGNARLL